MAQNRAVVVHGYGWAGTDGAEEGKVEVDVLDKKPGTPEEQQVQMHTHEFYRVWLRETRARLKELVDQHSEPGTPRAQAGLLLLLRGVVPE